MNEAEKMKRALDMQQEAVALHYFAKHVGFMHYEVWQQRQDGRPDLNGAREHRALFGVRFRRHLTAERAALACQSAYNQGVWDANCRNIDAQRAEREARTPGTEAMRERVAQQVDEADEYVRNGGRYTNGYPRHPEHVPLKDLQPEHERAQFAPPPAPRPSSMAPPPTPDRYHVQREAFNNPGNAFMPAPSPMYPLMPASQPAFAPACEPSPAPATMSCDAGSWSNSGGDVGGGGSSGGGD